MRGFLRQHGFLYTVTSGRTYRVCERRLSHRVCESLLSHRVCESLLSHRVCESLLSHTHRPTLGPSRSNCEYQESRAVARKARMPARSAIRCPPSTANELQRLIKSINRSDMIVAISSLLQTCMISIYILTTPTNKS